jgi:hypothetical protein
MKRKLLVLALVLVFTGSAFGSTMRFSRRTDWGTLANWQVLVNGNWVSATALPTTADELTYLASPTIASGTEAYAGWSPVGSGRTITINGSYTSGNRMSIGNGEGSIGTIMVNAGGVIHNEDKELYVSEANGIGVLNVAGTVYTGAVDILMGSAGSGTINVLPGGSVVSTGRVTLGDRSTWPAPYTGTAAALIISPGGSYSCTEKWGGVLDSAIANGRIRATPGAALIVTNHATGGGKTFTAVLLPKKTTFPNPSTGTTIGPIAPTLSWTAGNDAVSHEIYFGTNLLAVANAARMPGDLNGDGQVNFSDLLIIAEQWLTTPDVSGDKTVNLAEFAAMANNWQKTGYGVFKGYQPLQDTTYQPGTLVPNTTYYWRVDEVDSFGTVHKGNVWAFVYDSRNVVELIGDPDFQRGFNVADPTQGAWVFQGTMQWDSSNGSPTWLLAQWNSSYSIVNAVPVLLPSGSYEFSNETKRVVMGPISSSDADLIFMVDTRLETTVQGVTWPCLLADQDLFSRSYFLPQLSGLEFHAEVILHSATLYDPDAVGQFVIYFIVQDRNTASSGYGKYYWFGIFFYDNRYPNLYLTTTMYYQYDAYSGMMICNMPQAGFASGKIHDGGWVVYDGDILPRIIEAFNYFKSTGGIPAASNINDYCISDMNMGWEVPIPHYRGEVQVRNLSLKAVLP